MTETKTPNVCPRSTTGHNLVQIGAYESDKVPGQAFVLAVCELCRRAWRATYSRHSAALGGGNGLVRVDEISATTDLDPVVLRYERDPGERTNAYEALRAAMNRQPQSGAASDPWDWKSMGL